MKFENKFRNYEDLKHLNELYAFHDMTHIH